MSYEKTTREMQKTMEALVKIFPETGVLLLLYPLNAPAGARTNYISNCKRSDMLVAMKEVVARFEGRVIETETKQ